MEAKPKIFKNPMRIIRGQNYNSDNLHRIAISNLSDPERRIERWWEKKFKEPQKKYEDHTYEELVIKMLEDYYENNPEEIERFRGRPIEEDIEWDGKMSSDYEEQVQAGLKNFFEKNKVDLSKYQDDSVEIDEDISDEDILQNLRKQFPSRPGQTPKSVEEDEFDEDFS